MKDVIVREMRPEDVEAAAAIHSRLLRQGGTSHRRYDIGSLFSQFLEKSPHTCFAAERNDEVVGFIVGGVKDWGFGVERAGWIEMVEVDPGCMGMGIGKELGGALLLYFQSVGIREVYTSVRWDSGDLIEFFKSLGFDKSHFINLHVKL